MKKNVPKILISLKKRFSKVGESKVWKKLFVDKYDDQKIEEFKREAQLKHGMFRF